MLATDHDLFDYNIIKSASQLLIDTRGKLSQTQESSGLDLSFLLIAFHYHYFSHRERRIRIALVGCDQS